MAGGARRQNNDIRRCRYDRQLAAGQALPGLPDIDKNEWPGDARQRGLGVFAERIRLNVVAIDAAWGALIAGVTNRGSAVGAAARPRGASLSIAIVLVASRRPGHCGHALGCGSCVEPRRKRGYARNRCCAELFMAIALAVAGPTIRQRHVEFCRAVLHGVSSMRRAPEGGRPRRAPRHGPRTLFRSCTMCAELLCACMGGDAIEARAAPSAARIAVGFRWGGAPGPEAARV